MKKLIIGFSVPKKQTIFSYLIQKIEKTEFSHVYFKLYEPKIDDWLIFEAAGMATRCWTDTNFSQKNRKIQEVLLKISEETEKKLFRKAYQNLNKKYGIKQLFGLGLVKIHALFGKKIQNPYRDGQHTYICSEYSGEILVELGYNLGNLDELRPKELYEVLNGQTK